MSKPNAVLKVCVSGPISISLMLSILLSCSVARAQAMPAVITQAQSAFSAGSEVKTISLTGTATWTSGSTIDSGTFTLTGSEDGSSAMTLQMNARGAYQETYSALGGGRSCQWQGADGIAHSADSSSCALPNVWFLPSVSLQPSAKNITFSDNGLLPFGSASYHAVGLSGAGTSSLLSGLPADYGTSVVNLDPQTMLPVSLTYRLFPGTNPLSSLFVEVDYAQYASANGLQIPRSIVRHLNGAVDLSFSVSTVTVGQSSVSL